MALNFDNFETVLQTKLDTITDEKDMLLLGKAIEATVGNVAVSEIQAEGTTQKSAVTAEGGTQISAVQAQGTSERSQINAMSSGFATTSSLSPVATSGSAADLSNLRTVGGQSIAGPGGDIATVPAGLISMWSGSAAAIPSGWNLCDGTNGTPNLIGKFIKAASTAGATGGSTVTGAHTLSISEMPSHDHDLITGRNDNGNYHASGGNKGHVGNGFTATYNVGRSWIGNEGGGGSHSHTAEPPYFELCYIMKA